MTPWKVIQADCVILITRSASFHDLHKLFSVRWHVLQCLLTLLKSTKNSLETGAHACLSWLAVHETACPGKWNWIKGSETVSFVRAQVSTVVHTIRTDNERNAMDTVGYNSALNKSVLVPFSDRFTIKIVCLIFEIPFSYLPQFYRRGPLDTYRKVEMNSNIGKRSEADGSKR